MDGHKTRLSKVSGAFSRYIDSTVNDDGVTIGPIGECALLNVAKVGIGLLSYSE